jgi:iron(III) transport system permease protein
MKPGLANAFLVGFIESMADFGNPMVVGGQFAVLSTDIFFAIVGAQYDQGRAASLALDPDRLFALAVFFIQQRCWAPATPRSAARAMPGCPMPLPDRCAAVPERRGAALAGLHRGRLPLRLRRRLRADLGPRLHAHAEALRTAFDLQWGEFGLVWAGTAWNSLFTTVKLAGIAAPLCAALGLLIAWLLARTHFRGQRGLRVRRAAGLRHSRARCWA